jgi:hypothetical protein
MFDRPSTLLALLAGDVAYGLITLILGWGLKAVSSLPTDGPIFAVGLLVKAWLVVGGILGTGTLLSLFGSLTGSSW